MASTSSTKAPSPKKSPSNRTNNNNASPRYGSWNKKPLTWIIIITLGAILVATGFAHCAVGYKSLYLTPKWVWIIGSLIFALIPLFLFAIRIGNPFKEPGTFVFYLTISFLIGILGYGITDIGITWFYAINYWFREPQQITTKAIVTEDRWDYETHQRGQRPRTHYVNVLELPEEHRKITAVDGYIHCFPPGSEFDLVYSKGFFGIDIFENAININYPSED